MAQLEWEGRLSYFSYEERILRLMNIFHLVEFDKLLGINTYTGHCKVDFSSSYLC